MAVRVQHAAKQFIIVYNMKYLLQQHVHQAVVREISGISLDIMPRKSTVAMMAYDLGVISDLQVAEIMYMQVYLGIQLQ